MKKLLIILLGLCSMAYAQTCPSVTSPVSSSVGPTSARTSWTAAAGSIIYQYTLYKMPSRTFVQSGSGTSTFKDWVGLSAVTTYRAVITNICISGTPTNASAPDSVSFTTLSDGINYTPLSNTKVPYFKVDSNLLVLCGDTTIGRAPNVMGQLKMRCADSLFYYYNGKRWQTLSIDSLGIITRLNNKVDSVTIVGSLLYYWKQGVGFGQTLPAVTGDSTGIVNGDPTADTLVTQPNDSTVLVKSLVADYGIINTPTDTTIKQRIDSNLIATRLQLQHRIDSLSRALGGLGGIGNWNDSIANVKAFGADPSGVSGSALAFQNAINTGKTVFVPFGTYKIDTSLILLARQTIFGSGLNSILRTTNTSNYFNIIYTTTGCVVRELNFKGTGKITYPVGVINAQNAIGVSGYYNKVLNCNMDSLRGAAVQIWKTDDNGACQYNIVDNIIVTNSTAGVVPLIGAEYNTFSNILVQYSELAFFNRNGNNTWIGLTAENNTECYREGSSGGNNNHGVVTAFKFNHNTTAINIPSGVDIEQLFSNGKIYDGAINITDGDNVHFNEVALSTNVITITASGTAKRVTFTNCPHIGPSFTSPTWVVTGTAILDTALISGLSNLPDTTGMTYQPVIDTSTKKWYKQLIGTSGGMAIGGTVTSATAGSVFYAGTGGKLQQSNTNFFYDSTHKWLGLGTNAPDKRLEIRGDGDDGTLRFRSVANSSPNGIEFSSGATLTASIKMNNSSGELKHFGDASVFQTFYANNAEAMRIATTGALKFNSYGSGTFTGTATKTLQVDASGNIIEGTTTPVASAVPLNGITAATATNTINNGNFTQTWNFPTLTSGALLINAASTAMSGSSYVFGVVTSGANASSGIDTYAADFENNHTGTTSTNVALKLQATNGTKNYALIVAPNSGTVGIGTSTPVASALLEMTTTTQGLLPPRMTTTQKNAISSPAEGLIVYDLTLHKLCVYTGSAWETITSL